MKFLTVFSLGAVGLSAATPTRHHGRRHQRQFHHSRHAHTGHGSYGAPAPSHPHSTPLTTGYGVPEHPIVTVVDTPPIPAPLPPPAPVVPVVPVLPAPEPELPPFLLEEGPITDLTLAHPAPPVLGPDGRALILPVTQPGFVNTLDPRIGLAARRPLTARVPLSPIAPVLPVAAPRVAAPIPAALPVGATTSQFHSQDDFGGFSFGYNTGTSAKQETRTADGVTRGSYSYVDANGITQHVSYTADAVNGFRVVGTNIPVANSGISPANTLDTVLTPVVAKRKKRSPGHPSNNGYGYSGYGGYNNGPRSHHYNRGPNRHRAHGPVVPPAHHSVPEVHHEVHHVPEVHREVVHHEVHPVGPVHPLPGPVVGPVGPVVGPVGPVVGPVGPVVGPVGPVVGPVGPVVGQVGPVLPPVGPAVGPIVPEIIPAPVNPLLPEGPIIANRPLGPLEGPIRAQPNFRAGAPIGALVPQTPINPSVPALAAIPPSNDPLNPTLLGSTPSVIAPGIDTPLVPANPPVNNLPGLPVNPQTAILPIENGFTNPAVSVPVNPVSGFQLVRALETIVPSSNNFPTIPTMVNPVAAKLVEHAAKDGESAQLNTQFQAQDEEGGFAFGFKNALSSRQETKDKDGVVRGSYTYVDAFGENQVVNYVADPVHGFRVTATNLPVAPEAVKVAEVEAAEPENALTA